MGGAIITEHLEALVSALAFLAQIGLYPVRESRFDDSSFKPILGLLLLLKYRVLTRLGGRTWGGSAAKQDTGAHLTSHLSGTT